jgi:hypothetical protein
MAPTDMRFDVVDYVIFALLLLFSAAIGLFYGFIDKRKKNKKDDNGNIIEQPASSAKNYLLANKSMGVGHIKSIIISKHKNIHLGFSYSYEFTCEFYVCNYNLGYSR